MWFEWVFQLTPASTLVVMAVLKMPRGPGVSGLSQVEIQNTLTKFATSFIIDVN